MTRYKIQNSYMGQHFFKPSPMKFFSSRVLDKVKLKGLKAYFITSEMDKYGDQGRCYTLRAIRLNMRELTRLGTIDTISEVQEYGTRGKALTALKNI